MDNKLFWFMKIEITSTNLNSKIIFLLRFFDDEKKKKIYLWI